MALGCLENTHRQLVLHLGRVARDERQDGDKLQGHLLEVQREFTVRVRATYPDATLGDPRSDTVDPEDWERDDD